MRLCEYSKAERYILFLDFHQAVREADEMARLVRKIAEEGRGEEEREWRMLSDERHVEEERMRASRAEDER